MGKGGGVDQSAKKKARLEPPPNVQVKQEIIPHQATTGAGGGGGAMVAAEQRSRSRVDVLVSMDMSVLHCRICSHPYKPPVFRCKGGHMACGSCLARIPDKQCRKCEHGGSAFERCPALEEVVSSALIECAHDGCSSYVTYHEAGEHQSACPQAPCSCTEPGCGGFQGAPPALVAHLAAQHAMPVHRVPRASPATLHLPAPSASATERHLVIVEDDDGAFLLTVSGRPAGITAVSAVCIRAVGPPCHAVKMWANGPPPAAALGRKVDIVATCSAAPGAVDVEELTTLTLPRKFLVGGAAGAAKELPLNIRIDRR